jgi:cysteine-rich secretory family protein
MVRHGPDRAHRSYDEPHAGAKRALFLRLNRDRAAHGAPPLAYDTRAAAVGDAFCFDSVVSGSLGHWDPDGRAPYLRWGLGGGVDFHAQNVAAYTITADRLDRDLAAILLQMHDAMMAERPPTDGHRRTILDPGFTHVGLGVAVLGGELRMSQEFARVVLEWIEVPKAPLRVGQSASFAAQMPAEWALDFVEIRFEPPPRPRAKGESARRGSYSYPPVARQMWPRLAWPLFYASGRRGEVKVEGSRLSLRFDVPQPGHYFVLCYLRPRGITGAEPRAATASLVTAIP